MPSPTLFSGEKATGPLPSSPFAFVLPPPEPVPDDGAPKDFAALLALELAQHAESLGLGNTFNAASEGGEKPAGKAAEAAPKQSLQLFPSFAESAASQLNESAIANAPSGEAVAGAGSPTVATDAATDAAADAALEHEESAQDDIDEYDMAVAPFMLAVDAQPMLQWKPRQTGKLSATYQELVKPVNEATALASAGGTTTAVTNAPALSQPEQTVNTFDAPSFSPNFVPRTVADLPASSMSESLSESLPESLANLSSGSSGALADGMSDADEAQIRITAPLSSAGQQLLEDARAPLKKSNPLKILAKRRRSSFPLKRAQK